MKVEIANRLYEYRRTSGMSQEKVASLLGVSRQAVSKWECAESSPDTENLIALAQLYGVSVDELLFADPEEPEEREELREQEYEQTECTLVLDRSEQGSGSQAESERAAQESASCCSQGESGQSHDHTDRPKEDACANDYVDISLERGVHVKDSRKGEEVHVGWDGIHIDNDTEHVHIDFKNFKNIAQAIRAMRNS